MLRPLTVKLSGRIVAPAWSRGCTLSSSTRGDTTEFHGPLQRWLGGSGIINLNNGTSWAKFSVERSLLRVLLVTE